MLRGLFYRWGFFFFGLMMLGFGVALTIKGQRLGVGSWDVLHIGLFKNFGFTIGTWNIIVGIIIVTITSIGMREFPKVGTFLNMVLVGVFIDIFNWLLPDPSILSLQVLCFIFGVIFCAAGSGVYIAAELGAGPRDGMMLMISQKVKWSIQTSRTIMEILVVGVGFFLGGPVGIGTVIMAFGLGPIIQWSLKYSTRILEGLLKDKNHVTEYKRARL